MRGLKAVLLGIIFSLVLITMATSSARAEQVVCMRLPQYSLMYNHTDRISAKLTFDGDIANCKGSVIISMKSPILQWYMSMEAVKRQVPLR